MHNVNIETNMIKVETAPYASTPEQGHRTLQLLNAHRVVLRLTSYSPEPLERNGANTFHHALRTTSETDHADYSLTYCDHSYFLDFNPTPQDEQRSTLRQAVERVDTALFETGLPAAIVSAFMLDADSPQLSERYPDELKHLPNAITDSALDIFERHRAEMVGPLLDRLVFHPDFS